MYSIWKAFRFSGKTWNCILLVTDILCILSQLNPDKNSQNCSNSMHPSQFEQRKRITRRLLKKLMKECFVLNTNFTSFNITLVNINLREKTRNTALSSWHYTSLMSRAWENSLGEETRDDAVVRPFFSHQCDLGLIPGFAFICGLNSFRLILLLAPTSLTSIVSASAQRFGV